MIKIGTQTPISDILLLRDERDVMFLKKNMKISLIPIKSKSFSQFSFWGECHALSNSGPIFPDPSSDLFKRCCSSKYQFAQLQTDHFYGTNQTVSI